MTISCLELLVAVFASFTKKQDGGKVIDYGTKNLLDHADKCGSYDKTERKQSVLSAFIARNKPSVAKTGREKLRRNEAIFVGGCQLAFNVVDSAYFRRMCQNLINIGAKYGHVNANDVLVGRKTVRGDIVKLAESVKNTIREKLREPITEGTLAMTCNGFMERQCSSEKLPRSKFCLGG